jgi:hypothetical protein
MISKKINNFEVLTDEGWSDFTGIKETHDDILYNILFSDGSRLSCTGNHMLKTELNEFITVEELIPGMRIFPSLTVLSNISTMELNTAVYDLIEVKNSNAYFTNNVISHNCGQGNLFYRICQEAEEDKNGFKMIRLPWHLHPERDQCWRDQQDREMGKRKASQENDCDFLTSGATLILPERLSEIRKQCTNPAAKVGFDQGMWIWKYPMPGHNYLVAADVARGDGADSNAAQIIDLESLEQVAEYQGKLDTNTYGDLLVEWSTNYNNALLAIENTGIGWSVVARVIDIGYSNIYKSPKGSEKVSAEMFLQRGYDTNDNTLEGFTNSGKTRPLIINKLDTYLNNPDLELQINSIRLAHELDVFQWINRKAQAQNGYHDDLVMSYGIGLYIRDTALQLQEYSKNIIQSTLQSFKTGTSACKIYSTGNFKNPWSIQSPNGRENIDLTQFLDKR